MFITRKLHEHNKRYQGEKFTMRKDKFPLPQTQDLVNQLAGTKYFSQFDLRSGYW